MLEIALSFLFLVLTVGVLRMPFAGLNAGDGKQGKSKPTPDGDNSGSEAA